MWPFTKQAGIEEKSFSVDTSPEVASFLKFGSTNRPVTVTEALNLYRKTTAVSIPVNYVADAFASINPVLKIDGVIVPEHPILDLLKRPNPWFTQELYQEALAINYLAGGECEIIALGNINRAPVELHTVSPDNVSVQEGSNGFAANFSVSGDTLTGSYNLKVQGKRARYLQGNLKELKQIRTFSTKNNSLLRGESPLVQAASEARQHIQGNAHNLALLENGGRVSLVFHFDSEMNEDDFQATKKKVISQYGGSGNAGKIGVTAGGNLDIKELGTTNKDMDFANLQAMAQRSVALQYKVPLPLVTTDASTFNNYKEAKMALYDDAVLPLADRIYAGQTELIVPRFGLDPARVQITYDKKEISTLTARTLEELKTRKDIGIESDNELREALGREGYTGGEQFYKPANLIPVGSDLFTDTGEALPTLSRDEDGSD